MAEASAPGARCGIDSVEIARVERLLAATPAADLAKLYSATELSEAGEGPGRAASLAARFAAKEACLKLFPREAASGEIVAADFSVATDNYGAPRVVCSPLAADVLGRHRIASIALSLTHDRLSASAVALAQPAPIVVPLFGRLLYHLLPLRRAIVLANLRRVYADTLPEAEIVTLAQAHYAHLCQLAGEFLKFRWLSAEKKSALVRVENIDAFISAFRRGRGVLVLTGHFGNWEVATIAGIANYPEVRGRFHFVRRAIKPRWLDVLVTRRFEKGGFGVIGKRGSLDRILELLAKGDVIVFPFDQHAGPPDGIEVDFFGHPAWTFKSLAIIALATGAPVMPATSWREPDGRHVLRFSEPLVPVDSENSNEAIRLNTRAYNAALERLILARPEQWYWVHRRWKSVARKRRKAPAPR
ncbi:MAG TPA: 4'-phosphopantetheinyl transferase superfamily protein [Casimicrobiaceae bacterium]|nr:4'-phosphopantetheinyl transferase superfamily protein [Casimicrobiaceae bacterium]